MHIPDHAISNETAIATGALSAAALAAAGALFLRQPARDAAPPFRFAAVAALIFALQMLNFPVSQGTSGHFLGGTLAVAALGWASGLLAMGLVLGVQALLFGDGGLAAFGANFLTMALAGGSMGLFARGSDRRILRAGAASAAAVLLAAALCSALIVLSGAGRAGAVFPAMLGAHVPVAAAEALITGVLIALLQTRRLDDRVLAFFALACAAVAAPFASPFPDGLESALALGGGHAETAPGFAGLLPDYTIPALGGGLVSVSLAGAAGVAAVLALALILRRAAGVAPAAARVE